jgi:methylmalonyl-CoA/ethylmalonyl-CoA epimerase
MPKQPSLRLHHVGYVVASIDASLAGFCRSLGGSGWTQTWEDPIQKARVAFMNPRTPGDPSIELVEPAGDGSPVLKFLQRGGGLHHICYEVDDLDQELRDCAARGVTIIRRPQPAEAFEGRRIAWTISGGNLLVEYLESSKQISDG